MKAIAVIPGKPDSIHLRDVPAPRLEEVPDGRGVLVRVLRVGVDGTDKEINAAEYGAPPPGEEYLILGHESLGRVEAVGPAVAELAAGDLVVASVRRPGSSLYDRIGLQDMTTDDVYFERGINLRHGYLAELYAESADFLVRLPEALREVGVLLEPASVAEKAIGQAWEIQRRLRVWRPRRAAVLGTGTLGLLASLFLRQRGLEVVAMGRVEPPFLNSELLAAIGVTYLKRRVEIPADRINQGFVLGNKVAFGSVNASRDDFERGVADLVRAELTFPGWLARLLTHRVRGLESYRELMDTLTTARDAIKVFCEVAP